MDDGAGLPAELLKLLFPSFFFSVILLFMFALVLCLLLNDYNLHLFIYAITCTSI